MKKHCKAGLSLLLCAVMLLGIIPTAYAANTDAKRLYTRLADLGEMEELLLSESEARAAEYPNGAMMLVETSAELEMGKTYAIDVFRQGGVKKEAKIKLSTVDLTAGYNEAYRLYLSDDLGEDAVAGEKRLYYYETGVPYVARQGEQEKRYMTRDNVGDLDEAKQDASEINDLSVESMPHSTETVLTFAEGEDKKTVLVEILKPAAVTDDLEFMLTLSEPEDCSISANTSGVYKITENRPKQKAQLEIAGARVNPEDSEAFISVKRSGNLGGYDSFRVTTKSGTAKAETDYKAVAQDYRFIPNLSEIKIPVTVLGGAADGESFTAELSDLSGNAEAKNTVATVTFDKRTAKRRVSDDETVGADAGVKYVTDMTYKVTNKTGSDREQYRGWEFIDLSKFSKYRVLGDDKDSTSKYTDHTYEVGYSVCFCGSSHTTAARSDSPIDMYGVKSAYVCYDERSGSVKADTGVICFGQSVDFSNDDKGMSWRKSKSNCTYMDLWNVGPNHLTDTFSITDSSPGQYIYLCCYRSALWGYAGLRVHEYSKDPNCSFRLNLQPYEVTMIDPDEEPMYQNGKLVSTPRVKDSKFTDPADPDAGFRNKATFYRYDSTVISATVDSKYGAYNLKGIYLLNPDNHSQRSALIPLSGGQLKLTPDFLRTYASYIIGSRIHIMPCYQFDPVDFKVVEREDKTTGFKFTVNSDNCSGNITMDGKDYGTVTWSSDSRREGKYYDGDNIVFTYHPGTYGVDDTVNYEYRAAKNESDLPRAKSITVSDLTQNELDVTLENRYFYVNPILVRKDAKTRLVVSNPEHGDFISKGTKYAAQNADGSITVSGVKTEDRTAGGESIPGIDTSFDKLVSGNRIDLTAKPDEGYYAVWKYTDASTHEEVVRLGNTFNYVVQNPFYMTDNFVQLSFEKTESKVSKPVKGKICIPNGTILHPVTPSTEIKTPAVGAVIYMDGYVAQTDKNGQFVLKESFGSKGYAQVQLGAVKSGERNYKQTNRAIINYNNNAYVCDVTLTLSAPTKACATADNIVISSATTSGVNPTDVVARSAEISGVYGDTITLVNTRPVSFSVNYEKRNVPADKPVNLARWIFASEEGTERSAEETEIEPDATVARYDAVLSEKAKQGDHMYVEFYNKSYDSKSNEVRTFYGRFEVGYKFVNANIEKVMNYMPEIGFYDDPTPDDSTVHTKLPSAPGIGPVSPMVSLFGFLPIYSDAATGQKDKKTQKDLYTLEIGVQFSIARSQEKGKEGSWSVASLSKQIDKLSKLADTTNPAQNLNTSTKISLSITFAYQLDYYTADGGVRHYTQSCFLLGAKVGVKISIPFTIVAVPCFVYIDVSLDNVGYIVQTPNKNTDGYWTNTMLDNAYYRQTSGKFVQNFVLKFGVGVGWDGIASIGGHIDFNLQSEVRNSNHGKMVFGIKGGVFAELLFFKVDQTWNIDKEVLLDTDAKLDSVAANILNEEGDDLMANTKLSDLKLARASDVYDSSVVKGKEIDMVGADAAAAHAYDTYEESNAAEIIPVIGQISDNRYLIATALDDDESLLCLRCYIYDAETHTVVEKLDPVCDFTDSEAFDNLTSAEKKVLGGSEDMVAGIDIIDCGDKLLLIWESAAIPWEQPDISIHDFLQTFKVTGMLFDKKTGKFTDFSVIDDKSGKLADRITGMYDPKTETVHVFYENIDVSEVNDETTLEQISDQPMTLSAASACIKDGTLSFSKAVDMDTKGNTVSDYDVASYNGKVLLSYICAENNSPILEQSLTTQDYDPSKYGTENHMYLNRYAIGENGALSEEDELLIADKDHVTANPEFVNISYQGVDNTLLFYKCNGRYGYQNVDNLYMECEHYGITGVLDEGLMEPEIITMDEDHTVGDDFDVYYDGESELYALWTLSEGDQKQIWGRQFEIEGIIEEDTVAKVDDDNQILYNSDGSTQTETLEEPIKVLHGFWGNKVRLTTGGVKNADGTGFYKGCFDAIVSNRNHLIGAYEAFDYDFGTEREGKEIKRINNRFVISEFDICSAYASGTEDPEDAIDFSEYYPNPGETVEVTVRAANIGFRNGRDVTLRLRSIVNGTDEIVDEVNYPIWLAGADMEETLLYTVPDEVLGGSVELYYEVVEDGKSLFSCEPDKFLYGPNLSIEIAYADPESVFTEDNRTVRYDVSATVNNIGNKPYDGGDELDFIYNDLVAQANVLDPEVPDTDPFYINFGGITIPALDVGCGTGLSFVSREIREEIFDKHGTGSANLRLAITPQKNIGWIEIKGDDRYCFLDEMGIGQFVKPVPVVVTAVEAEPLVMPLGEARWLITTVTPSAAADKAEYRYATEDNDIISVDENGEVTALKEGVATVTVSCGDVETDVRVTVIPAGEVLIGDVNKDGRVDISDSTLIQRAAIDLEQFDDVQMLAADVNDDGRVSVLDATCVQKYVAEYKTGTGRAGKRIEI